jgi:hypothetical protein
MVNADSQIPLIECGAVEVKLGVYKDLNGTRRVDLTGEWSDPSTTKEQSERI